MQQVKTTIKSAKELKAKIEAFKMLFGVNKLVVKLHGTFSNEENDPIWLSMANTFIVKSIQHKYITVEKNYAGGEEYNIKPRQDYDDEWPRAIIEG